MHKLGSIRFLPLLLLALALLPGVARAQTATVHATIAITHPDGRKGESRAPSPAVVLWLKPAGPDAMQVAPVAPGHFRMAQKDKAFHPHLLVVPLGSTISFPNLDPFFHNVFSQFNGKRFDLGLYEAGSTKDVRFDHEGVSYIFCNIHPEMSAVVITLSTPWYATSAGDGSIDLKGIPAGSYEMHVWAEGADARELEALTRRVRVDAGATELGVISLATSAASAAHKNKFGEDYRPGAASTY